MKHNFSITEYESKVLYKKNNNRTNNKLKFTQKR